MQFPWLNSQCFKAVLFSLLEYDVHVACYIRSKLSNFSINFNTNVPQNGTGMYLEVASRLISEN